MSVEIIFSESCESILLSNILSLPKYITHSEEFYRNNQSLDLWQNWVAHKYTKFMLAIDIEFEEYIVNNQQYLIEAKNYGNDKAAIKLILNIALSGNYKNQNIARSIIIGANLEVGDMIFWAYRGGYDLYSMDPMKVDSDIVEYNYYALLGSCCGGHLDFVKTLLRPNFSKTDNLFYRAIASGNIELVEYLLLNNINESEKKVLFEVACFSGNIDMIKMMGTDYDEFVEFGLYGACASNSINIIEMMIEKGAKDWEKGFYLACVYDKVAAAKIMLDKGANDISTGLELAYESGCLNIVFMLHERYPAFVPHKYDTLYREQMYNDVQQVLEQIKKQKQSVLEGNKKYWRTSTK